MYDDLIAFLAPTPQEHDEILRLLEQEFDIAFHGGPEQVVEQGKPIDEVLFDHLRDAGKLPPPLSGESESEIVHDLLPKAKQVLADFLDVEPSALPGHGEFERLIPLRKRRRFFNHLASQLTTGYYVPGSACGCWTLFLLSSLGATGVVACLATLGVEPHGAI
ncbi:MAG TPA: hypothetical protein DEB39_12400, partial [Planctomycetaceae bacterium]|nr:hypothetical protein [Planctomycetaceae bacterium]